MPQPLRLPPGSIRAVLALLLSGSLWYQVFRGVTPTPILVESALLVVGFYFGVRSGTGPPIKPVQMEGVRQPLFLPRGSIRLVLLLGFFGVIAYTWSMGQAIPDALILILQVLASYVIGYVVSGIVTRRRAKGIQPIRAIAIFRNVNAVLAIVLTGYLCGTILFAWPEFLQEYTGNAIAWIVAYYFGSRLAA